MTTTNTNTDRVNSLSDYIHNGVYIMSSGKFELEPIFAPYYWFAGLDGFADHDDGTMYTFKFTRDCDGFAMWPELRKWLGRCRTLRLRESEPGFVHCF